MVHKLSFPEQEQELYTCFLALAIGSLAFLELIFSGQQALVVAPWARRCEQLCAFRSTTVLTPITATAKHQPAQRSLRCAPAEGVAVPLHPVLPDTPLLPHVSGLVVVYVFLGSSC